MARTESDPQGNTRIVLELNGVKIRVYPEGARIPYRRRKTKDGKLGPHTNALIRDTEDQASALETQAALGGERSEQARRDLLAMFPSSKPLRNSAPMREDQAAATKVTELLDLVENDYRTEGKRSLAKVLSALVRPREYFKGVLAADCDGAMLLRYRDDRSKEVSAHTGRLLRPATINRELVFLHSAFTHGQKRNLVKEVPPVELFSEKGNARQGFFEHDEFLAVLKYISPALKPVVQTLYVTGWRRAEVLGLNRHNLDLKANRLRLEVGTTKNLAGREFVLTAELRAVLVAQVERIQAIEARTGWKIDALFVYDDGARVRNFKNMWTKAVRQAYQAGELRNANMLVHDFRRTVVRNLARANVPMEWAMKVTGHKTTSVFQRYSIVNEATAEATARQYEQFMAGQGMSLGTNQPIYSPTSVVVPENPVKSAT